MWLEHVVADWRKIPPPALPVGEVSLGGEVEVGQDCAGVFFYLFPILPWHGGGNSEEEPLFSQLTLSTTTLH
jgi:hypothetical protein